MTRNKYQPVWETIETIHTPKVSCVVLTVGAKHSFEITSRGQIHDATGGMIAYQENTDSPTFIFSADDVVMMEVK